MPPTETCMTCHSQIWTHAEMLAPVRGSFADARAAALDPRLHTARLRLFQSQHPYRERRRLHRMPRADRRDAADLEGARASYGCVPGLPPQSGAASAPAGAGLQPALAAHLRYAVRRTADGGLSHPSARRAQRLRRCATDERAARRRGTISAQARRAGRKAGFRRTRRTRGAAVPRRSRRVSTGGGFCR